MHLSIGRRGAQVSSRVSDDRRKWRNLGPDFKQSTTMLTNEETTAQRYARPQALCLGRSGLCRVRFYERFWLWVC